MHYRQSQGATEQAAGETRRGTETDPRGSGQPYRQPGAPDQSAAGRQTGGGQYGQRQAGRRGESRQQETARKRDQWSVQSAPTRQQEQGLSPAQQRALGAVTEAIKACTRCADRCLQEANPEMVRCIRLCAEVGELGRTAQTLLTRDAEHATDLLCVLQAAMTECASECVRHPRDHCRDCATTLDGAIDALARLTGGRTDAGVGHTGP